MGWFDNTTAPLVKSAVDARNGLQNNSAAAGQFGQYGATQYQGNQVGLGQSIEDLRRLANGQNSVSAMQLQQALQQNLAAQQSMAAGAAPGNAAMAARNAQMNMGRLGYGLAGQQAVAGQQERNAAQQALGQLQLGQSGQNLQAALGGYGTAIQGYGAVLNAQQQAEALQAQKDQAALNAIGAGVQVATRGM